MRPFCIICIKKFQNIYEKLLCFTLIFFITPGFYIFELTVVRPAIVNMYRMSLIEEVFHVILSTFCFINVVGNMIMSIFTDTSLKIRMDGEEFCNICRLNRPAQAWHCKECNTCILRRDHHCFFFSRCIGLYNQRYFVTYTGYIFISMVYSTYFNYFYVTAKFDDYEFAICVYRIMNPLVRHLIPEPVGMKEIYVLFIVINAVLSVWSGLLFSFHLGNVLRGITTYENRKKKVRRPIDKYMWRENMSKVFGVNWYWALLWPFAYSPLPKRVEV